MCLFAQVVAEDDLNHRLLRLPNESPSASEQIRDEAASSVLLGETDDCIARPAFAANFYDLMSFDHCKHHAAKWSGNPLLHLDVLLALTDARYH